MNPGLLVLCLSVSMLQAQGLRIGGGATPAVQKLIAFIRQGGK